MPNGAMSRGLGAAKPFTIFAISADDITKAYSPLARPPLHKLMDGRRRDGSCTDDAITFIRRRILRWAYQPHLSAVAPPRAAHERTPSPYYECRKFTSLPPRHDEQPHAPASSHLFAADRV